MTHHVAVNPTDHKDVRISTERSYEMGDGAMCCVTFPQEFRNLQAHYPVLFQMTPDRSGYVCLALLGFENGENLFLENGGWTARYIPLSMDIHPFLIGVPSHENEDPKVVIDMDSPRLQEGEGNRLFDEAGMPTTYLENISTKLAYLDEGFRNATDYCATLQKFALLEPLSIDITLRDGSKNRLMGFHTIHEENLAGLSASAIGELHAKGYLFATHMAIASLSNLANLIERKDGLSVNVDG